MKILWVLACLSVLAPSPAGAGAAAAGRAKAEIMCQTCHGLDGIATVPMAANLSGQQEAYLIVQLEAYRDGKRRHEQMSIIAGSLSDDDIKNLAAWYPQIKVIVEIPQ